MKLSKSAILTALVLCLASCSQPKAKYVFLFIGDGMGFGCLSVAETYLAQSEGEGAIGMGKLAFSDFPVMGAASTFSADHQRTDSAASGSALSSGEKFNNSALCISPAGDTIRSIAYKLHDVGYKVGIMATVCIDHATPGAFYGQVSSRGDYYEIGSRLADTGFEFFGGGDFNRPDQAQPTCYEKAESAGYAIAYGREEFQAKKDADKVIFFQKRDTTHNLTQLPTHLERMERNNPDDITLAELVSCAVEKLDNSKGFFMMAEGSMIDYAAHSNNLPDLIFETLDFSDAVAVAMEFYKKHPKNTLIVVTADHETGGPACTRPNLIKVNEMLHPAAETNADNYLSGEINLSDLSKTAGVGWTATSHTADRVPVYAIGAGSEKFAGEIDNTDIPRKICEAMGVNF
ncbi:MAG: alkaline phosphatase [Bacteroidales bacterium]|nr:alkaline phosphatase [Bacteroidales bacterium]